MLTDYSIASSIASLLPSATGTPEVIRFELSTRRQHLHLIFNLLAGVIGARPTSCAWAFGN
jgi:hypothetical protein